MATLVLVGALQAAFTGTAVAAGTASFGATLGYHVLAGLTTAIGSTIDGHIFGGGRVTETRHNAGNQLKDIQISGSAEGKPISRIFGSGRLEGNLIWTTKFKQSRRDIKERMTTPRGKFTGGSEITTVTEVFEYSVSCAFAFGEIFLNKNIPINENSRPRIKKIYINGKEVSTETINTQTSAFNVYDGYGNSQIQGLPFAVGTHNPDDHIQIKEGNDSVPGYKDILYIVFADLQLAKYGNRIPQVTIEVEYPILETNTLLEAFTIPANGEIGYATTPSIFDDGQGNLVETNINSGFIETDFIKSYEQIPSREYTRTVDDSGFDEPANYIPVTRKTGTEVTLTVPWFGTSDNAANCTIFPKTDFANYESQPYRWLVGDYIRTYSTTEGHSGASAVTHAKSGTPSDWSLVEAMKHTAVGTTSVNRIFDNNFCFMPELVLDINGTPDKSSITDGQNSATFFGTNSIGRNDFAITDNGTDAELRYTVRTTTNPFEPTTNYARFIYHYAHLLGANSRELTYQNTFYRFFIGNDFSGLTNYSEIDSSTGRYVFPAIQELATIARQVKLILASYGSTAKVSYACDVKDYYAKRINDTNFAFHMDELWKECDFIGINWTAPISDWRSGTSHRDYGTGFDEYNNRKAESIYDVRYLRDQVFGGEGSDYYYANPNDRENQVRTAYPTSGTPVVKYKNLTDFMRNPHQNVGPNVDTSSSTNPLIGKKVVFTNMACPAVNKGTNNPRGDGNNLPYFSNGSRDDYMQRVYYRAIFEAIQSTFFRLDLFTDRANDNDFVTQPNHGYVQAGVWDTRPFPSYPARTDLYEDADEYAEGKALNGRFFASQLGELIKEICSWVDIGEDEIDVSRLTGNEVIVDGFVVDNQISPREALTTLSEIYLFDACESEGKIVFKLRSDTRFENIDLDELVLNGDQTSAYNIIRSQAAELERSVNLTYINKNNEYQVASEGAQRQFGDSHGVLEIRAPVSLSAETARALAEVLLQERWTAREQIELVLPPNKIGLNAGDAITITLNGKVKRFRITSIQNQLFLTVVAESVDPSIYDAVIPAGDLNPLTKFDVYGSARGYIMDIPLVTGTEPNPYSPRLAAYQNPFPPSVVWFESSPEGVIQVRGTNIVPSQVGRLSAPLGRGAVGFIDYENTVDAFWADPNYQLMGLTDSQVLSNPLTNLIAVKTGIGENWELIKFFDAEYLGEKRYRLSRLIRGKHGSYTSMVSSIPVSSPVVVIDSTTQNNFLNLGSEETKKALKNYQYGSSTLPLSSPFLTDISFAGRGIGEKPLPPVHPSVNVSGGFINVSWLRQTRFGGINFQQGTVPLNETSERYKCVLTDISAGRDFETIRTTPTYSTQRDNFVLTIQQIGSNEALSEPLTVEYP